MTDPTIATVDEEPWNQFPTRPTLAERKKAHAANAPILQGARPKPPPQFVYEANGHSTGPKRCQCGARSTLTRWREIECASTDPRTKQHRESRDVREIELCNTCSNTLKGLPLGERWNWKR
jgi:hypothetical protein